jgi:hypothetical protein
MGGKKWGKYNLGWCFFSQYSFVGRMFAGRCIRPQSFKDDKRGIKISAWESGGIVVDVRIADDWKKSDLKIKGAIREDPEKDYRVWASKYPKDKTLVFTVPDLMKRRVPGWHGSSSP